MKPIKTYWDFIMAFNLKRFSRYYGLTQGQEDTLFQHLSANPDNNVTGLPDRICLDSRGKRDVYDARLIMPNVLKVVMRGNLLSVTEAPKPQSSRSSSGSNNNNCFRY